MVRHVLDSHIMNSVVTYAGSAWFKVPPAIAIVMGAIKIVLMRSLMG